MIQFRNACSAASKTQRAAFADHRVSGRDGQAREDPLPIPGFHSFIKEFIRFCRNCRIGQGLTLLRSRFLRTFFSILPGIRYFSEDFLLYAGQGLAPPECSPSPILCAQNGYMASKGRKAIGLPDGGLLTTEDAADWLLVNWSTC